MLDYTHASCEFRVHRGNAGCNYRHDISRTAAAGGETETGNVNTGGTASIRTLKEKRDVRGRIGSGLFSKVRFTHGVDLERYKSSSRPQRSGLERGP